MGWEAHPRSGMHKCKKKGINSLKGFREPKAFFVGGTAGRGQRCHWAGG